LKSTENSVKTAGNSAPSAGKSYKAVFIDLDDTIWDFHTNAELALKDMYDERGLDKHFTDFDQFFSIYAKRNIELWEQYGKGEVTKEFLMMERFRYPLAKMGIDDEEMAVEIGNQYLDNLPGKKTLMPFAIELLDYLKAKKLPHHIDFEWLYRGTAPQTSKFGHCSLFRPYCIIGIGRSIKTRQANF
jgi:beta-phosphoglucomutase-like phosphatase (HAD superfamily)